ncbi:MAG: urea transporter [Plesiomonas sp.]|uniref:urea transporter n=1 Tax=Plesiomonas sp. TaxID=2486279 RepID=UPI003F34139A
MSKIIAKPIVSAALRGAGQVFFCDNPITGSFFLLAIFYAAFNSGEAYTAIGAVVGLFMSTFAAKMLRLKTDDINQGLHGFNGILVGIMVTTFFIPSPLMWVLLLLGATLCPIVESAISESMSRSWGLPGSTAPFVLISWMLLLAGYNLSGVHLHVLDDAVHRNSHVAISLWMLLQASIRNIAQVFLLNSTFSGVLILIGLAVHSRAMALTTLGGALLATTLAQLFGANTYAILTGLYGFSPVLSALAIGRVFYLPTHSRIWLAMLATFVTVIVQAALNRLFTPLGLPTFTAAYLLTLGIFMLAQPALQIMSPKKE